MSEIVRCDWVGESELMREYHDREWGVPVRDDTKLFEFLLLDAFQAGLSWSIILRKRDGFRAAFRNFDPVAVASMNDDELDDLTSDAGIIRNRSKIVASRENARALLRVQEEIGSFSEYFWSFVGGQTKQNRCSSVAEIPAETEESRAMSADMRRRGFKFAGPTILYAVMQSAGLVNDHVRSCYRYEELGGGKA